MILCDRCENPYHRECAAKIGGSMLHDGPWFCPTCKGYIAMHGPEDITHDYHLIDHLWAGFIPQDLEESERV